MTGADNQQERATARGWVVGFIDGEGTFSISLQRNATMTLGWQVFPEFVVTQGAKSLHVLEEIQEFFFCGRIFVNNRRDNHRENIYRYCVRRRKDLCEIIVPFFLANPLRTSKSDDFEKFVKVLELMENHQHLSMEGLEEIARIVETMNRGKPSRLLQSSETIRQTSRLRRG